MKTYRYGKRYFLLGIFSIVFAFWLIYLLKEMIDTLILICTISYGIYGLIRDSKSFFTISDEKLVFHKKNQKFEIYWKEVKYISAPHSIGLIISQICIYSNEYNKLLITWWFSDYRELIRFALEKSKNNDDIIIDDKVFKFIKNKDVI